MTYIVKDHSNIEMRVAIELRELMQERGLSLPEAFERLDAYKDEEQARETK